MSLQVWLPLNGNLNNQGLDSIGILTSTNCSYTTGKIGQCLNMPSGYTSAWTTPSLTNMTKLSIAYWVKVNEATSTQWLDSFHCYLINPSGSKEWARQEFYSNCTKSGFWCGGAGSASNVTNTVGEWTHWAITIDLEARQLKLYKNGVLAVSNLNLNAGYSFAGTQFRLGESGLNLCECDFRLFDHVLSPKEVKEISKGLILHYKLDGKFLENNAEYDCSGYNNETSIIGTLTDSTDTPRYNKSTKFNGSNSAIKIINNNWMPQGMSAMTINLWAKNSSWNSNTHFFSCAESGGFNTETGQSGYLRFPVHVYTTEGLTSTAYKYDSKELQLSALSTTDWNMITWVYDSTGTKTYINGVLHHTYTNTSYGIHFNTNARLFLGCEASGANPSSPYYGGYMSDFRLYATAFSADDILELYQTAASIDSKGNLFCGEVVE